MCITHESGWRNVTQVDCIASIGDGFGAISKMIRGEDILVMQELVDAGPCGTVFMRTVRKSSMQLILLLPITWCQNLLKTCDSSLSGEVIIWGRVMFTCIRIYKTNIGEKYNFKRTLTEFPVSTLFWTNRVCSVIDGLMSEICENQYQRDMCELRVPFGWVGLNWREWGVDD